MAFTNAVIFMNSTLAGKLEKSKSEELRVSVLKNNMVDVRVYSMYGGSNEYRPTKKGIWLSFKHIPEIVKAIIEFSKDTAKDVSLEYHKRKAGEHIRVYTNMFKEKKLLHIRTFYEKDGEYLPGRGVSVYSTSAKEFAEILKNSEKYKS